MPSHAFSTRRELLVILACSLLGAGLRFWSFGTLGLTHFDEGVYALSGLWSVFAGGLKALDPGVIPYAPPGLPLLIGTAYLLFGVSDASALLVSTSCGVVTIPAVGWLGRRTFGPGAGAASAALAALSMAHVAFSRKALTDVPFLLLWIVAIGLAGRLLERPSATRAAVLGIAVGLAQNFKYNGWLTGAIVAIAAAFGVIDVTVRRLWNAERRRATLGIFGFGIVAAGIALLVYGPWIGFVERHGGYLGLVHHHQSYVGGPRLWAHFLNQQVGQVAALSGGVPCTVIAWVIAIAGCAWSFLVRAAAGDARLSGGIRLLLVLAGGAVAVSMLPSAPWWIGLGVFPWLLLDDRPARRLLAVWWLVLSILTPFYHPYARLWLPLHAAGWLLEGGLIVELVTRTLGRTKASPAGLVVNGSGSGRLSLRVGMLLGALILGIVHQSATSPRAFAFGDFFRPTSALKDFVAEIPGAIPPGEPRDLLRVLGRRPIAFYLFVQGRYPFRLLAGPEEIAATLSSPVWLIVDEVMVDSQTASRLSRLGAAVAVEETLDPVTLLDVAPEAAFGDQTRRQARLWLVRGATEPGPVGAASTRLDRSRPPFGKRMTRVP